ncbi:hypothetical protein E0L36_21320 [Streptomyces sp. AJS327]|uniref:histidine kinase n=1 Tax=Streptomyces sp. AJS327 TaxID=2545265 RepID=UPI0017AF2D96|nr:histidine kinase [Streptomyces sp. AJS327]MBA0053320.1 hypothetical protein [Streptomyces sp. AJS327]
MPGWLRVPPLPPMVRDRLTEIATATAICLLMAATSIGTALRGGGDPWHMALLGWLLTVAVCAALPLHRERPVLVALFTVLATGVYYITGVEDGPLVIAPIVALYHVAAAGHTRAAVSLAALMALGTGAGTLAGNEEMNRIAIFMLTGWLIAVIALGSMRRGRLAYAEAEARRQATEERLRVAREVHDVVGHHISLINVQASAAVHRAERDPGQAVAALRTIKSASRETLRELRATLGVLRRADTPDAAPSPKRTPVTPHPSETTQTDEAPPAPETAGAAAVSEAAKAVGTFAEAAEATEISTTAQVDGGTAGISGTAQAAGTVGNTGTAQAAGTAGGSDTGQVDATALASGSRPGTSEHPTAEPPAGGRPAVHGVPAGPPAQQAHAQRAHVQPAHAQRDHAQPAHAQRDHAQPAHAQPAHAQGRADAGHGPLNGAAARASSEEPSAPEAPPGLDRLPELLARAGATGVRLDARFTGLHDGLPPEVERDAYRIVQESLTNALRHATPTRITVHLTYGARELELRVENDDPDGAPPPAAAPHSGSVSDSGNSGGSSSDGGRGNSRNERDGGRDGSRSGNGSGNRSAGGSGSGVRGMRERARQHGGELTAGPRANAPDGYVVHARLPYQPAPHLAAP